MNAYVDTSVLLRVILGERGVLRGWRSIKVATSSEIIRVEALRTLDRARIRGDLDDDTLSERRRAILDVLGGFRLVALDRSVLERAAEPFPTALRTLDALHLATATLLRRDQPDLVLATHDHELARAGRSLGFTVVGARA